MHLVDMTPTPQQLGTGKTQMLMNVVASCYKGTVVTTFMKANSPLIFSGYIYIYLCLYLYIFYIYLSIIYVYSMSIRIRFD